MEQMISKILISYDHIKEKEKLEGEIQYSYLFVDPPWHAMILRTVGQVLDRVMEPPRIRWDFWVRSVIHAVTWNKWNCKQETNSKGVSVINSTWVGWQGLHSWNYTPCAQSLSRLQLFATLWTVTCQAGSSIHGISQGRILEWVTTFSSWGSSWPRNQTSVSCVSWVPGKFFTAEPSGKPRDTPW